MLKTTYLLQVRQLIFTIRTFGCCQNLLWNVKSLSALSDSIASFTVTMLASVSSGSNLDRKQVLLLLTMEKPRSSSALERGIVKISLKTFQRRGKRRAFSMWSFISPIKLQSESNFKSPRSILLDSITWSRISLSRRNWYWLNSSVMSRIETILRKVEDIWDICENNADVLLLNWLKLSRGTQWIKWFHLANDQIMKWDEGYLVQVL